jgi:hypothetical protein
MTSPSTTSIQRHRGRFILVDHSIRDRGGHHLEYASHMLDAAKLDGYEPLLVTNKRFPIAHGVDSPRTLRVFGPTCYDFMRIDARVHGAQRPHAPAWWIDRLRLELMKRTFVRGVRRLLDLLRVDSGDLVFFSTVTPIELIELAGLSRTHPAFADASMHAMLHFPLHDGHCPPLEQRADVTRGLRTLAAAPRTRIAIHATNAVLASQFRALGCAECDELPWAVSPEILRPREELPLPGSGPLRIGVPGSMRDERGGGIIASLFDQLRGDLLDGARAQLLLQSPGIESLPASMRASASFHETVAEAMRSRAPVAVVRWPASGTEYAALIRAVDLGLLPYDPARYYARASGVLVELLGSGVPVVVLAGSWLGRQFRERVLEHADLIQRQFEGSELWSMKACRLESQGDVAEFQIDLSGAPASSVVLALSLRWSAPSDDCSAMLLTLEPHAGHPGPRWRERIERRPPCDGASRIESQSLLVPMQWRHGEIRLRLEHAGCGEAIEVDDLRLRALHAEAGASTGEPRVPPLSSVGLLAADPEMLATLVREAVEHYPAYRASARGFAEVFREAHLPQTVIGKLRAAGSA